MNTLRLSKAIETALNAQLTREAAASQIYLSFGSWVHGQGFNGIANFLFRHAQDEHKHMVKILEYILKRDAVVCVAAIPARYDNPLSVNSCFARIFANEVNNSIAIYQLAKMSFEEEDWGTWSLMQWFMNEQMKEESLAFNFLDKLEIAGGDKASNTALYSLDMDMEISHGETEK